MKNLDSITRFKEKIQLENDLTQIDTDTHTVTQIHTQLHRENSITQKIQFITNNRIIDHNYQIGLTLTISKFNWQSDALNCSTYCIFSFSHFVKVRPSFIVANLAITAQSTLLITLIYCLFIYRISRHTNR